MRLFQRRWVSCVLPQTGTAGVQWTITGWGFGLALGTGHPLRLSHCRESSSAGCVGTTPGRFRITHPFHPLRGAEYELVTRRLTWGEDRVFYYDQAGALKSFLSNVTDVVPEDAFGHVSAGRSAFRADDLLELRRLIDGRGRRDGTGKEV
jgi:hypothetical protein